ncbi:Cof-type HAD-IIB family hydrolase [Peterkaempfera griseoplana]|uniref:Cof-type HAD-IIB family hydrolase n=1 Tax=Peterkaempfera griseoplana TaxID=66896 RepID=UPI0006E2587F|nr:Cof-type HAD-IIB family hydrolase [Peterkaempfera griseoplana]
MSHTPIDGTRSRLGLVATDLDGTLLRSDATVSARTVATLGRLAGQGVVHVIATGRPASGCAPFFEALGYRGLAVCGQGAQVYDAGRGELLSSVGLDRDTARAVVTRLVARIGPVDLAVVTSGLHGEFVVTPGFSQGDERELAPFRLTSAELLWDAPVDKVLLRHPTLSDADLVAAAEQCCVPGVTVTHAGPRMVDLLPTGFDKATGLARVARSLGLDRREVIAFGDMPNDLAMLSWAGYAVAMSNGHPELKAVADEIAPHHDEDGVAAVLDRILDEGAGMPARR